MAVARPTPAQLNDIADSLGMSMKSSEIEDFLSHMEGNFLAYDLVESLPDYIPEVKFPRTPGVFPPASENIYNAWYVKTNIMGAPDGKLKGKTIALKDNVCLAGVPMMNGSSSLEGYVPNIDATVVTRLLDAGATIAGKAHCEYFCFSGGSHTGALGPVHNPRRHGYSAGGSSSGSAVLVAAGEVDMAIGCDQGGSIRMPSAYCGTYGMKPTHGLVPYTGIMPIESTIDHAGPITANVADNALMLEVLAGEDGLDPRQYAPKVAKYTEALARGVKGMKIAIVREGFRLAQSEEDVDAKVRAAAAEFVKFGAEVVEISLAEHAIGAAIWTPVACEGAQAQMMLGNGMGFNWKGLYNTSLIDAHAPWRERADSLSDSLKITMLVGQYFMTHYRGRFYAKSQNLTRMLKAAYDNALGTYDLLLMPTVPLKATPLPPADAPLSLVLQRAFEMIPNTAPFDITGHPAMAVPCGMSDGLPISMMLIGKHFEESTIYAAAAAFEANTNWLEM
ncbi:amidase [Pseudotabrizicola sp. 4114]|uniref:amidase n=1 Tax=Pseudotabrizicola sp. 4114 TaxID=2817731 RepID=UPI002856C742|nr:amidase [Pseudorhodobacter sp. 4114]